MADVIIQIYGIRTTEDERMVVEQGAHHIGVSYGKIKRTPGQLTCEQAKQIFEGRVVTLEDTCDVITYIIQEIEAARTKRMERYKPGRERRK